MPGCSSLRFTLLGAAAIALASLAGAAAAQPAAPCQFSDSHFHLKNYVQEGPSAGEVLKLMGARVCRSTLFALPLQQEWLYHLSADIAPTYYLESDAPLY